MHFTCILLTLLTMLAMIARVTDEKTEARIGHTAREHWDSKINPPNLQQSPWSSPKDFLWRDGTEEAFDLHLSLGLHMTYIKCLAVPGTEQAQKQGGWKPVL